MADQIVPIHPDSPPWLARHNKVHDEKYQPYRFGGRLVEGITPATMELGVFTDRLRKLTDIIDIHHDDIMVMIDVHAYLDSLWWALPHCPGWLVVKNYRDHVEGSDPWTPRTWIACITEAQANEMAPAIEGHYRNRDKHLKTHDTFTVVRGHARVLDFIDPECTVDDYLRRLRS